MVGQAKDGEEAVQFYQELRPDLVTMDISMPNKDGIQALEEIMGIDPTAKVIVISALNHRRMVFKAIKKGATLFGSFIK